MVNQLFRAYVLAFALLRRGVQVSPDPCKVNRLISKLRRRGRRGTPVKKGCYNLVEALWGGARDFDSNFLEISGGLTALLDGGKIFFVTFLNQINRFCCKIG